MSKKETCKRYLLFIISLFFTGFGIALAKHGELGVSPVASVANVFSLKFTFFSLGTWVTISCCFLLLGQIVLLRRNFEWYQFLQIPLSFLLGYFTDFGMWMIKSIPNDPYIVKLLFVLCGIISIGLGVTLGVIANVILSSGEAFVKALSTVTNIEFSTMKIIFDVSWVSLSIVLSLLFFDGQLLGTREGTILSAIFVGVTVRIFRPRLQEPLTKLLTS